MSNRDKSANKHTSSNTKISTSIGTTSSSKHNRMIKMKSLLLRKNTPKSLNKTELPSRPNFPLSTNSQRNFSTSGKSRTKWPSKKIISRLTKSKCALKNSKKTKDNSTWLMFTRRYWPQKLI